MSAGGGTAATERADALAAAARRTRPARTRIKVCCIRTVAEAELAVAAGADALGLVGDMPTGPGIISEDAARLIADSVAAPVAPWLLTSQEDPAAILDHAVRCRVSTVQIVRPIAPADHDWLAEKAPWLRRVQVLHVEDASAVARVASYGARPHTFLLDSGRLAASKLGGTGRIHDWAISAECVAAAARPVFLAGGLRPDNAAAAVAAVAPFGLDICSGLRREDHLVASLLDAFVGEVRRADAEHGARGR